MCRCAPHHSVLQKLPDPPEHSSKAGAGGTAPVPGTQLCSACTALHAAHLQKGWVVRNALCLPMGLWQPGWLAKDVTVARPWDRPTPKLSSEPSMLQYLKMQILKKVQTTCHSNMIARKCCHPNAPS